jgi:two-component system sensor histidine kinase/response regulator
VRSWGMHPTCLDGARSGLAELRRAAAAETPYKLVLSDLHMPDVDGYEFAAMIHADPSLAQLSFFLLSSGMVQNGSDRARELGISGQLLKPIKQSELFNAVYRAMSNVAKSVQQGSVADAAMEAPVGESLSILVAEDNVINQLLAQRLLEKAGHRVQIVRTGLEVLKVIKEGLFDLILMDIQMPEMDGLEAAKSIRKAEEGTGRHLPIVALTAHAMKTDEERCLASGMDAYVAKPIEPHTLFATVRAAAETRR